MHIKTNLFLHTLLCSFFLFTSINLLAEDATPAFFPTWKLLKQEDKIQYLAGYMHAWQDAHKTLSIAADFVEEKPEAASESIKKLQRLYDFSSLRPDTLTREIDAYYADSNKQASSLSQALTAARARLR